MKYFCLNKRASNPRLATTYTRERLLPPPNKRKPRSRIRAVCWNCGEEECIELGRLLFRHSDWVVNVYSCGGECGCGDCWSYGE